jgi:hypothetical protein
MFMDSAARLSRAGRLTVFPRFIGGTGNPVSPVSPRHVIARSYKAFSTHYQRRGTKIHRGTTVIGRDFGSSQKRKKITWLLDVISFE